MSKEEEQTIKPGPAGDPAEDTRMKLRLLKEYDMKLYLISQDVNKCYDTYDSAVVCAQSKQKARMIHPNGDPWNGKNSYWGDWADACDVKVKLIGTARLGINHGVICASFNAG